MFRLLEGAKEIPITVQSWTKHMPKMTQPNLDYIGETSSSPSLAHAHAGKAVFSNAVCLTSHASFNNKIVEFTFY